VRGYPSGVWVVGTQEKWLINIIVEVSVPFAGADSVDK
jgi:hypothetical protein